MRAALGKRMISIMALVLVIGICFLVPKAAAQSDKYPKMAPVDQYLMERNAEILLARSAAPDSISSDATTPASQVARNLSDQDIMRRYRMPVIFISYFCRPKFLAPKVRSCFHRDQ